MCNYFVVITLLFCATPTFGLTAFNYHNNYGIFRPVDNGLGFDLRKRLEILFLDRPEEPSFESSRFALKIEHNHHFAENVELVNITLYKNGVVKYGDVFSLDDQSSLRNMQLGWETSGRQSIRISVKTLAYRALLFSWVDPEQKSESSVNITHLAFKVHHSMAIHLRDSFFWLSNVYSECPHHKAELSCALNIPRHRSTPLDEHANSSVSKVVRKVMEMRLLAKPSSSHNYEMFIVANQTNENVDPRLHIMRDNIAKVKMNTIVGAVNLSVNGTSGHITLRRKNSSAPFFSWNDEPAAASSEHRGFQDVRFITVEVAESTASRSHHYGNDEFVGNVCNITCIEPVEVQLPWYTRWKNKLTRALSQDAPSLPARSEDES